MENDFKKYSEKREAALCEFRKFIKSLVEKEFTVQQLIIIGTNAQKEITDIVADIEANMVLTQDLSDLLK